jgi:hypothetical protein
MNTSTTDIQEPQELAFRANDGIEVGLYWHGGDVLTVQVFDAKTCVSFEIPAPADHALDVYYHPFAYASDEILEPAFAL